VIRFDGDGPVRPGFTVTRRTGNEARAASGAGGQNGRDEQVVRSGGEHDRVPLSDWERKIFAVIQAEFHRACQRGNLRQLGINIIGIALFEVVSVAIILLASQADPVIVSATAVLAVTSALFALAVVPRPVPATLPARRPPLR
jgi:hypothetical protein